MSVGFCCRYKGPIGVRELMGFFDDTHRSINAPQESTKNLRTETKRIKTEVANDPPGVISLVQSLGADDLCLLGWDASE